MNYYLSVVKNYVGFSGRARRAEFWQFFLVNAVISVVLEIIGFAIKTQIILDLYSLALLLPSLAVAARRLHDTGKSAWLLLLYIVLFVGWVVLIVFWCLDSTPGANKHGENPKGVGAPSDQQPYNYA